MKSQTGGHICFHEGLSRISVDLRVGNMSDSELTDFVELLGDLVLKVLAHRKETRSATDEVN